jgi:hypothetical protein
MATVAEDVLHIHSGHDGSQGGGKVTNQLGLLRLPSVASEPRLHLAEVLASAELHSGEGNADSLSDSRHHSPLAVLH